MIIFLFTYFLKVYIYFLTKISYIRIENIFFHKNIGFPYFSPWKEENNFWIKKSKKKINIEYVIENGDTLINILTQYGTNIDDINLIIHYYPILKKLKIGQSIFCIINKNGKLQCLIWNVSQRETRIYTRISNSFKESILLNINKKWNMIVLTGKLVRNFISSARSAGLINIDIKEIIKILQWKLDFRKLHKGDQFSVLLNREVKKNLNNNNQYSHLLGIHFKTNGKDYYAFRAKNGKFYGKNADLLSDEFIRFPIKTKFRISSSFNIKRVHPIIRQIIPHRGVDFAVPSGTPVLSIGDGKVIAIKKNKIAGNYITIQHNFQYVTRYMHLKKSLVKIGQNVKLGEYIGISGNTGRSTGPHLHFEIWVNHKAVNPLTVILPKKKEMLTGYDKEKYLSNIRYIISKLQFN